MKTDVVFFGSVVVIVVALVVWVYSREGGRHALSNYYHGEVRRCLVAGYPDYLWHGEELFCKRRVNGTDVIVPVKSVP